METRDLDREFDSIVKEVIAPIFKDLGFKKSGTNFYRKTDELIQTFNIQRSPWNSKTDLTFTGNIGLIEPEIYLKLYETDTLPRFPKYTDSLVQLRLGKITHGRDHWYKLASNSDIETIKQSLSRDLQVVVMLFESRKAVTSLEDFLADRTTLNPFWGEIGQYAFYKKIGKDRKAKELLESTYRAAQKPRSWFGLSERINGFWKESRSKPEVNKFWLERIERVAELYNEELK